MLTSGRRRDALELAALLAGYLALTWLLLPAYRTPLALAAVVVLSAAGGAWIAIASPLFVHRDAAADRGLGTRRTLWVRTDNLARAAPRFALLALASAALLAAIGRLHAPERLATLSAGRFLVELGLYLPLALVQDLALVFVLVRLNGLFGASASPRPGLASAGTAAAVFALVHAPNPVMMALAGLFALGAATAFGKHPNLAALVVCHAFTGAVLRSVAGLSTRVGPFTAHPEVRVARELLRSLLAFVGP